MSSSKYSNGKKRLTKKTRLIYAEGLHEEVFLKFLHQHFSNKNVPITIKRGKGGSADQLIVEASKTFGGFTERVVVLDEDKPKKEIEKAVQKSNELGIIIVKNFPCLESVLLSILDHSKEYTNKNSAWCKKEFQNKHIHEEDRDDLKKYERLFPLRLLVKRRKTLKTLDNLIKIVESKRLS